ncbi:MULTISPECIES: hypothetical protein [Citricoccus]|uniref:hypothetical protein n=1 Tax=Citricoccus TaxID=169133 RepID=UPI000255DEB2|nr:hypothetical protein [Citricoccus sp. CH26A]
MTHDPVTRDEAGRALYAERSRLLPGLGHPPAPPRTGLEDPVREHRWRMAGESAPLPDASGGPRDRGQARASRRVQR